MKWSKPGSRSLLTSFDRWLEQSGNEMSEPLHRFQRINVVGNSGSGKSTFARQISEFQSLPYFEMDQLFWKPNWQEAPDSEFIPKVEAVVSQPRWVLDGNYSRTTKMKWDRAQLVVWMDTSFPRTIFRVTKRAVQRSISQKELWPNTGNRETFAGTFLSRDSIILWSLTNFRRTRTKYSQLMVSPEYASIHFVRLRTPSEVASCLAVTSTAAQEARFSS